jgi:hypothetical protein
MEAIGHEAETVLTKKAHDKIFGPFFSFPSEFLSGFSAASGIALINSMGNLGGFAGPIIIGAVANGAGGIYRGLALAGVSAALVLLLPARMADRVHLPAADRS